MHNLFNSYDKPDNIIEHTGAPDGKEESFPNIKELNYPNLQKLAEDDSISTHKRGESSNEEETYQDEETCHIRMQCMYMHVLQKCPNYKTMTWDIQNTCMQHMIYHL